MPTAAAQQSAEDPRPLRPPNKPPQPEAPIYRELSSTSKKACDTDDAAARTSPRVSPSTRREVGDSYSRHPPRRDSGTRRCHRIGAGRTGKDFSRMPNPTSQSEPTSQTTAQPCAITVAPPPTLSRCEHHHEAKKTGEKIQATGAAAPRPSGREPPPPSSCGRLAPPAPPR